VTGVSTVRHARGVWLAASGLLVLGCVVLVLWFLRESEPTVRGTVRLDGQLLPNGSIALVPIDGTPGPGGGGGINKEGKYEIKRGLLPGRYRVEIRSSTTITRQVRNPTIPSELVHEEVSVIPEQYNTRSSLIREVSPGSNVLDFDLKGVAARK
jgi:hypothetical protein